MKDQTPIEELIKLYENKRISATEASDGFRKSKMEVSEMCSEALAFAYHKIINDLKALQAQHKAELKEAYLKGLQKIAEIAITHNKPSFSERMGLKEKSDNEKGYDTAMHNINRWTELYGETYAEQYYTDKH
jgi:hypothetical protein